MKASPRRLLGRPHQHQHSAASKRRRRGAVFALAVAVAAMVAAVPVVSANSPSSSWGRSAAARDGLGIHPGKIKHVWLIILENKSYDATFTGLNNNTYLWQTLPSQGVLLKNYYGTGHFSLDNYISMVSGQATAARHPGRLPLLRQVLGLDRHRRLAAHQPELRPDGICRRDPTRRPAQTAASIRRACRRSSISSTPPTSAGRATPRISATPMPAAPTHDAGAQYCGAPYGAGSDRQQRLP